MTAPRAKKAAGKSTATQKRAAADAAAGRTQVDGYSDRLRAEALAVLPPVPSNAPRLRPLHQVPRRARAKVVRALDDLVPMLEQLDRVGAGKMNSADVYDLLADIEDLLAPLAEDEQSFRDWSTTADETELMAMIRQFMAVMSPGEA